MDASSETDAWLAAWRVAEVALEDNGADGMIVTSWTSEGPESTWSPRPRARGWALAQAGLSLGQKTGDADARAALASVRRYLHE